jgi:hypothetical protein
MTNRLFRAFSPPYLKRMIGITMNIHQRRPFPLLRLYSTTEEAIISSNFPTSFGSKAAESDSQFGPSEDPGFLSAVIWFENVFPFKIPLFDPRVPFISRWADRFLQDENWKQFLPLKFPDGSEFKVKSVNPNFKEGGCYMEFKYKVFLNDSSLGRYSR